VTTAAVGRERRHTAYVAGPRHAVSLMGVALLLLAGCKEQPLNDDGPAAHLCPDGGGDRHAVLVDVSAIPAPATISLFTNFVGGRTWRITKQHHPRLIGLGYRHHDDATVVRVPVRFRVTRGQHRFTWHRVVAIKQLDIVEGCGSYFGLATFKADRLGKLHRTRGLPGVLGALGPGGDWAGRADATGRVL
jgi:hypothetical protein